MTVRTDWQGIQQVTEFFRHILSLKTKSDGKIPSLFLIDRQFLRRSTLRDQAQ